MAVLMRMSDCARARTYLVIFLVACALGACGRDGPESSSHPAPARGHAQDLAIDASGVGRDSHVTDRDAIHTDPPIYENQRALMGTLWTVTIVGGEAAHAKAASERAFDEVARLEALLSEWQPESEISRVNRAAGIAPVHIGPELAACVRASLAIARWSDGAFDISWASMKGLWDFSDESAGVPPTRARVKERLSLWDYRNIVLDEARGTLFLKRPGMQIGLGGIGKGYALDRAGALLRAASIENYLLFAGGQVLVHGSRGDRPWRVGIQHPREGRQFAYVELHHGSLATSGDYEHAYTYKGRTYHHIIDPKTGFPSRKTSSVTLVGESALWADAVDTALFIMGPTAALSALADAPGGPFGAAIVDPEMRLYVSPGMREKLMLTAQVDGRGRIGREAAPVSATRLPTTRAVPP